MEQKELELLYTSKRPPNTPELADKENESALESNRKSQSTDKGYSSLTSATFHINLMHSITS